MKEKILDQSGKMILLGNDAIVRGALEAGLGYSSAYPGTPSSEIAITLARIAKQAGIYFEYASNEKVALESSAGAALSGVKSICPMKHFGVNVTADSLMPLAYVGASPLVIVSADDPNCWSSAQSEQDNRHYSRLGKIPCVEPSDSHEAKEMTKFAFKISEKYEIPVILRTTTRVNHGKGIVKLDKIPKTRTGGLFEKNPKKFNNLPPFTMEMHKLILDKIEKIRKLSENTKFNFIENEKTRSKIGIIVSGVSYNYVVDALDELEIKLPILKLGLSYPLPNDTIKKFIKNKNEILVVEELDPILEEEISVLAKETNPKLKIHGKDLLPITGEYDIGKLMKAIGKLTKTKIPFNFVSHDKKLENIDLAKRLPAFCAGCPHRATFYAVKKAAPPGTIFGGDIGCYILGIFPPFEMQDFNISMGANVSILHGVKKVSNQKVISFLGDSTFFHSGMPAVANMVYNNSPQLLMILDNRYTAMTGHQKNPGTGETAMGEKVKPIDIENVVKSLGVKNVKVVDPLNTTLLTKTVKSFLDKNEPAVIITRRECQLTKARDMKIKGIKQTHVYEIDQTKCLKCKSCILQLGCPAISEKNGKIVIDKNLCADCGLCANMCPNNAIKRVKK